MKHGDFEKAVRDESYRQHFIDNLDLEDSAQYIKSGGYSLIDILNPYAVMSMQPPIQTRLFRIKKQRSKIMIYLSSFEFEKSYHKTIDDFFSSLIDHEGFHCKECFENPTKLRYSITKNELKIFKDYLKNKDSLQFEKELKKFDAKKEIRAHQNQINNFNKRDVSDEYAKSIIEYKKYLENLLD